MKKILLTPLLVGLLLAGCSRNSSTKPASTSDPKQDSSKTVAAENPPTSLPSSQAVAASPAPATTASTPAPTVSVNIPPPATPPEAATAPGATATSATSEISPSATASPDLQSSSGTLNLAARIAEWKLTPDDITESLKQSDRIERAKPIEAGAPTGPMETGTVTNIIAGKLQGDAEIAPLKFGVMVFNDVATLTGSARSPDQIGRAMALTLDTEGVSKVVSRIKLEPASP